ncbi:hypothetical protein ACEWY4_012695 [Coilia grayii]|uniref:Integrase zinc-binding domain-containing protein n=1 Tax=Coilia grayii TaxID=363190 RepID=A0ABD1K193_9TELE
MRDSSLSPSPNPARAQLTTEPPTAEHFEKSVNISASHPPLPPASSELSPDTLTLQEHQVKIQSPQGTVSTRVGIVPDLPVPVYHLFPTYWDFPLHSWAARPKRVTKAKKPQRINQAWAILSRGMEETYETVTSRFYWSELKRAVEDYCRHCAECQLHSRKVTYRNPLIPLPVIHVPFKRIGGSPEEQWIMKSQWAHPPS